ncbi:MAG: Rrf2 family transcriptional regulator [Elusimicrobiota bacterium]
MIKVSTRGRYGLRTMLELALQERGKPIQLKAIARSQRIPQRYLAQLAQELRNAGLLTSTRGALGGFALAKHPSRISLLEIVSRLEGPISPVECLTNPAFCDRRASCAAREVWNDIGKAVSAALGRRTLQDLVKLHQKKKRLQED